MSAGVLSPIRYIGTREMGGERKWGRGRGLTRRTMSPLTRVEAGTEARFPERLTRQEGGIIARKEARIASDLESVGEWVNGRGQEEGNHFWS